MLHAELQHCSKSDVGAATVFVPGYKYVIVYAVGGWTHFWGKPPVAISGSAEFSFPIHPRKFSLCCHLL